MVIWEVTGTEQKWELLELRKPRKCETTLQEGHQKDTEVPKELAEVKKKMEPSYRGEAPKVSQCIVMKFSKSL